MTNAVKAMLLSGLVFPGLGQLALKCYMRGIALTLATLVCLYVLMERVVQQALDIAGRIDVSSGVVDVWAVYAAVHEAGKIPYTGPFRLALWALLILWLIGGVDAYVQGGRVDRQAPAAADRGRQK